MLRLLLSNQLYDTGLKFKHHAGFPNTDHPAVVCVPGRYYAQHTDLINEAIQRFVSVLLVVTSDEEGTFPVGAIRHERLRVWVQTPRKGRDYPEGARFFGVGFPPHFNQLPTEPPVRNIEVFCSAQNTHIRRTECFEALKGVQGRIEATAGFTQGMDPAEYVRCMVGAKIAPAPSGAVSPDSFRAYEALEAHAVPLVDAVSPVDGPTTYWETLFPGYLPFPVYQSATELKPLVTQCIADWPAIANRVAAWWMQQKRRYRDWLVEDLTALGAI